MSKTLYDELYHLIEVRSRRYYGYRYGIEPNLTADEAWKVILHWEKMRHYACGGDFRTLMKTLGVNWESLKYRCPEPVLYEAIEEIFKKAWVQRHETPCSAAFENWYRDRYPTPEEADRRKQSARESMERKEREFESESRRREWYGHAAYDDGEGGGGRMARLDGLARAAGIKSPYED